MTDDAEPVPGTPDDELKGKDPEDQPRADDTVKVPDPNGDLPTPDDD